MPTEPIVFTRQELYQKVWSEPLRTIAKQLGISDVALAKRCRKLNIPLPGLGYWAKKAAGYKLRQKALPSLPQTSAAGGERVVFQPSQPEPTPREIPQAVAQQEVFELDPANRIAVADTLRAPHPLVRGTAEAIRRAGKAATDWVSCGKGCLDMQVTRATADRALRIMDAVVKAFHERGWPVAIETDYPFKAYATILGQRVPFGIRERIKKVANEPAKAVRSTYDGKWYTPHQSKYRDEPTRRLSLVLRSHWERATAVEASWDESAPGLLENRLNDFMIGAVSYADHWREWERRRVEGERLRMEAELRRAEEVRRRQAEAARLSELEEEADRWHRSRMLRAYMDAIRLSVDQSRKLVDPSLQTWLDWATDQANRLDPLPTRAPALGNTRTS
jgi:hypothetical protein